MPNAILRQASFIRRSLVYLNGTEGSVVVTPPTWRIRICRWLVSFIALSLVYQLYALLVVPAIEPSLRTRRSAGSTAAPTRRGVDPIVKELFPPDAWERNDPKVLQTHGAKLLFREYSRSEDGRMELRPCTIIFDAPARGKNSSRRRRPIVLRAPEKAVLSFSGPLDLPQGQVSRLKGAMLEGEIHIFSPPTEKGANDALDIITRNVQILPRQIWTPHEVAFQYGASHGKGRDLSITLTSVQDDLPSDKRTGLIKNVESLELVHIDKLFLNIPTRGGLLGEMKEKRDGGTRATEVGVGPQEKLTEVEVTCRGPFEFDFQKGVASLEDHVDVVHINPDGPSDQLNCDTLRIYFEMPADVAREGKDLPSDRTTAASPSDAEGVGRLSIRSIEATGFPVTLRAPSVAAQARGEMLKYDFRERRVTLVDKQKASFAYRRHQVEAVHLEYVLHEEHKRLGLLAADGPGVYQGRFGEDDQLLKVVWSGQMKLQPQEGLHVLSVVQGADITWHDMGRFTADELFVWLEETQVAARPSNATPGSEFELLQAAGPTIAAPDGRPTPAGQPASDATRWEVRPVKMLARGNVHADSERFRGDTPLLEIWFQHPVEEAANPATSDSGAADPDSTPQQPSATDNSSRDVKRLELAGQRIRVHVLMSKPRPKVLEATVIDGVRLAQTTSRLGDLPLVVTGDMLQLRTDHLDRSAVDVVGAPARVQAQGMLLEGSNLHVSQRENRMWAEGPGRMKLPARIKKNFKAGPAGESTSPPVGRLFTSSGADASPDEVVPAKTPVWISWQDGMEFDGQLVRFLRQVEVRAEYRTKKNDRMNVLAIGDELHATLNQYVAFEKPKQPDDLDVIELRFLGEVFTENQTFNVDGIITSRDRMKSRDMTLDRRTGNFQALGPGWITSTRYDRGNLQRRVGMATPPRPSNALPNNRLGKLIYVRVDYQNAIQGNVDRRMVEFKNYVRTVYGPVKSWDQTLDPDRRGGLGRQGIVMTCNHLFLSELEQADGRAITMSAVGNTQVEGQAFVARADRLTFDEAKEQLVFVAMEGNFAHLQQRNRVGEKPTEFFARKIMYWVKTGQVEVFGARKLDYSHIGSPDLPRARLR